jgi:Holliday junction resolvasome RuvABC endonuclease subunit
MKILSLDLSSNLSGWALFDNGKLVEYGAICTKKASHYKERYPISTVKKCVYASQEIAKIINTHKPDVIVYEEINPGRVKSIVTIKSLSFLHGYIFANHLDILDKFEVIKSSQWRSILGLPNQGDKKKTEAVKYVNNTFNLSLIFEDNDIADAICQAYAFHLKNN